MRGRIGLILALLCGVQGCATLSEGQCVQGDWYGIGDLDARSGHTPDRLAAHREACAEYGIGVDPDGYHAGYEQGLLAFCVPESGFDFGRRGGQYGGQCPRDFERDFVPAYELGQDLYALDQELLQLSSEIEELREAGREEDITEEELAANRRALRHAKDYYERREADRYRLLERARSRGYGQVW